MKILWKSGFFLLLFCLLGKICPAQTKVELSLINKAKQQTTLSVPLKDDVSGDILLMLPVTFKITDARVLIVAIGNGTTIDKNAQILLFQENAFIYSFLQKYPEYVVSNKMQTRKYFNAFSNNNLKYRLYQNFDNNTFETIVKNPKIVMFQISDNINDFIFDAQFYIAFPQKKGKLLIQNYIPINRFQITIET
jgi:hypothetical protein